MTRLEVIRALLALHQPTKDDARSQLRVIYATPDPEKLKVTSDTTPTGR